MSDKTLKIFPKLPFIYELKTEPHNDLGIPDHLPFTLTSDDKYDLIKQDYNEQVYEALIKGYKISSILGGNSTDDEIGNGYTDSILDFVNINLPLPWKGLKVLDIGCGTGFLLHKLSEFGFLVNGIEPGGQAKIGFQKYKIPIVNDFFPLENMENDYDLVISILVLEHIMDPESFIAQIRKILKNSGKVILGVPNEEPYISSGDISTLFHEHWNYFTPDSFFNFLHHNGAENIIISKSSYGGLLYGMFNFSSKPEQNTIKRVLTTESSIHGYVQKIEQCSEKFRIFFEKYSDRSIGIYVPGRIVNFLISENINISNLRFFDDDQNSFEKFYPGINIPVENFNDMVNKPTDIILIMSSFFGEKIRDKILANTSLEHDQIHLWDDFFDYLF
jgi:SAM-dependent methyltransferase